MDNQHENQYIPPTATLDEGRRPNPGRGKAVLGVIFGASLGLFIGAGVLLTSVFITIKSSVGGALLVLLFSVLLILVWATWSRWPHRYPPFDLGLLITLSALQALTIALVLLQFQINNKRVAGLPNPSFNSDPTGTTHFPVSRL